METAIRIDEVPKDKEADLLTINLDGPVRDVWEGLSVDMKDNAEAIKDELR